MFLKIIFYLFVLVNVYFIHSQNTNVIVPKPTIEEGNLDNLFFQNGDKIQVIYESNVNYKELWNKYSNQSLVLITNNNDYLYNYKAVNDPRNICRINNRVISKKDLLDIKGRFTYFSSKSNSLDLVFYKSKLLNDNSDCDNLNNLEIQNNEESFIALKGALITNDDNQKYIPVVGFNSGLNNNLLFSYLAYNQGFPIRCMTEVNYKEYYQNNYFSYKEIAPSLFNNLNEKILHKVEKYNTLNENTTFNFNCELIFDDKGNNKSILKSNQIKSLIPLQNEVFEIVKTWSSFPFYEDIKIKSNAEINLKLQRFKDSKSKYLLLWESEIRKKDIKNISVNSSDFKKAVDKGFLFNYKIINYRVELDGYLQKEPVINVFNKVKGKGPVYSLLSIVPGLGQLKINQQDGFRKLRMWHFSVPIGAIAIASKIYSNLYYSKYLKNIDASDSRKNYVHANISQKVFLSSLGVYSVMSLVDFSITFTIGCKNKMLQYKINTQKI